MGPGTRCFPYQWVQLQTYESRTLLFMTSLQYHCILGLAEMKLRTQEKKIVSNAPVTHTLTDPADGR